MNEINWELVPVWIQAIGSLGGVAALYFLWQTLKAQNKTLKEQQKLTDLEHRRYLESIMPILELNKKDFILDKSVLEFILCVDKNYLFNLIIETTFAGISDFDDVKKVTQNFPIGSAIVGYFGLTVPPISVKWCHFEKFYNNTKKVIPNSKSLSFSSIPH